jgi:hypothetical protein
MNFKTMANFLGAKFPIHAQPGQKDVRSLLQSYFQLYTECFQAQL